MKVICVGYLSAVTFFNTFCEAKPSIRKSKDSSTYRVKKCRMPAIIGFMELRELRILRCFSWHFLRDLASKSERIIIDFLHHTRKKCHALFP